MAGRRSGVCVPECRQARGASAAECGRRPGADAGVDRARRRRHRDRERRAGAARTADRRGRCSAGRAAADLTVRPGFCGARGLGSRPASFERFHGRRLVRPPLPERCAGSGAHRAAGTPFVLPGGRPCGDRRSGGSPREARDQARSGGRCLARRGVGRAPPVHDRHVDAGRLHPPPGRQLAGRAVASGRRPSLQGRLRGALDAEPGDAPAIPRRGRSESRSGGPALRGGCRPGRAPGGVRPGDRSVDDGPHRGRDHRTRGAGAGADRPGARRARGAGRPALPGSRVLRADRRRPRPARSARAVPSRRRVGSAGDRPVGRRNDAVARRRCGLAGTEEGWRPSGTFRIARRAPPGRPRARSHPGLGRPAGHPDPGRSRRGRDQGRGRLGAGPGDPVDEDRPSDPPVPGKRRGGNAPTTAARRSTS